MTVDFIYVIPIREISPYEIDPSNLYLYSKNEV